jgi:maltooligosyltrehalose synthase
VGDAVWHDTVVDAPAGDWLNVFTGESVSVADGGGALPLDKALSTLPWAVLAPTTTMGGP